MSTKTVYKLSSKSISSINNRDEKLFDEFNSLLNKNIECSRSVKFYAESLAISTKKLNNLTKIYSGKTAKEFIENKIIDNSKTLLIETPDTVKQISYSMGFTEPTNFNKFFKKFTTTTPQQFREQYNKGTF